MTRAARIGDAVRGRAIFLAVAAALAVSLVLVPEFRSPDNLANLVRQSAVLAILAIGQTWVVVAGLIDLSVGMTAGLVVVVGCDLMAGETARLPLALAAALAIGGGVGALNGLLYNVLRIHSLILTFGMLTVLQGVTFVYTDRSVGAAAPAIRWLADGSVLGLPVPGLLVAALAVAAHLGLAHTRLGLHVHAVGGHGESARRAGVDVARVRFLVFCLSGLTAALGGLVLAGRLAVGYPHAGQGLELDALVAVVLGGATLGGGRGTIAGTLAAVVLLGLANNLLNLLEVSAFVQMLIKGLIVIAAILANQPAATARPGMAGRG